MQKNDINTSSIELNKSTPNLALNDIDSNLEGSGLNQSPLKVFPLTTQLEKAYACLEMANFDEAMKIASQEQEQCRQTGNLKGEFDAYIAMSTLMALQSRLPQSEKYFESALRVMKQVKNFDWAMEFYARRALVDFIVGSPASVKSAYAALALSQIKTPSIKAIENLLVFMVVQKKYRFDLIGENSLVSGLIEKVASLENSKLNNLMDLISSGQIASAQVSVTEARLERGVQNYETARMDWNLPSFETLLSANWIYDSRHGIIIDMENKRMESLQSTSPLARFVVFLNAATESVPMPKAFETVWQTSWVPERHRNTVKVSIGRVGRMCRTIKIRRVKGELLIPSKGIVI